MLNTILLPPPLIVPPLFAAAALLAALLAAAQPQGAPPASGGAPDPTHRYVRLLQGPTQEESDLQLLIHCLHHHQR